MVNSILCLHVKFEELVGFKWTFGYMNFILWKMDWIKDIDLGITRIYMTFTNMRLHEAILGKSVKTGDLRNKIGTLGYSF